MLTQSKHSNGPVLYVFDICSTYPHAPVWLIWTWFFERYFTYRLQILPLMLDEFNGINFYSPLISSKSHIFKGDKINEVLILLNIRGQF